MTRAREMANAVARRILWIALVPAMRLRARRRVARLRRGAVTIVTVNWNSRPFLEAFLRIVRARSPAGVTLVVVDNGSEDDTSSLLAQHPEVRSVRLPFNAGHDLALDIGFLVADTEYVVALDIDAFPVSEHWLEQLLAPLSSGDEISGARLNREYVHPCCLAMRSERFVKRRHSFRAHYRPRAEGRDASGDIGEEISGRERGRVHFFDPTSRRGPGDVGTVFGGIVYHNFYSTRFAATDEAVLDAGVSRSDPAAAWTEALALYDV
jgi:glycosyltransferase involved in cell wall biosynthesis